MAVELDLPVPGVTPGPIWAVKVNASLDALANDTATAYPQTLASSSWSFSHTLGRVPAVTIYVAGEQVEADVNATETTVSITFSTPVTGLAVLN
jgi:hypothetical protein